MDGRNVAGCRSAAADKVAGDRAVKRKPPPIVVAAAERDYREMRARVAAAVRGARHKTGTHGSEIHTFAEVYYELLRADPRVAAAMGAAAILQLAAARGHGVSSSSGGN
jgi:hypothetical protein